MPQTETYEVKVGGEYACFSRPEFKVERVTYPVMTPSAARGLLEAIFWKPEIRWEIDEIRVLNPINQTTILRNEIKSHQSPKQNQLVVEEERQQRSSMILKDVAYVIRATMVRQLYVTEPIPKYTSQFERRLDRGQYHHTPYLGTREFAAWFEPATGEESPIDVDRDIGTMLFDIARIPDQDKADMTFKVHDEDGPKKVEGYAKPLFFDAKLESGVLDVPRDMYETLRDLEGST